MPRHRPHLRCGRRARHIKGNLMRVSISSALTAAVFAAIALTVMPPARAADDFATYFKEECVDCHRLKKQPLEDKHLTRQQWQDAVDKMIQMEKVDPVPSKQFIAGLVDWLAKTHGPAQ
jgi:hypothetical protein